MKKVSSMKMRWAYVVPCTNRSSLRTELQKDINEILNSKLATIMEEPTDMVHEYEDEYALTKMKKKKANIRLQHVKKLKELRSKFKRSGSLLSAAHLSSIKESYIHFLTGFVAKASLTGS